MSEPREFSDPEHPTFHREGHRLVAGPAPDTPPVAPRLLRTGEARDQRKEDRGAPPLDVETLAQKIAAFVANTVMCPEHGWGGRADLVNAQVAKMIREALGGVPREPPAGAIEAAARTLFEIGNRRLGARDWNFFDERLGKTLGEIYLAEAAESLRAAWGKI